MRKFRFEGNNRCFGWNEKPINGSIYSIDEIKKLYGEDNFHADEIEDIIDSWGNDDDYYESIQGKWVEVFDGKPYISEMPKPLHKDTDLGYFAGIALSAYILSNRDIDGIHIHGEDLIARWSIEHAQELIKQLDEQGK